MEEQNRQFKGIWIPKEIWLSEELTIQEKIILVEIDSLENEEKGCYASNKYFANFFKITNGRVSQLINSLVEKGYLKVQYIYNGKEIKERQIRINKPPYPVFNKLNTYLENYKEGIKYIKQGYLENYKENNIYINNTINNKKVGNFKKPTIEEIQQYIDERNNGINANAFYDFYESKNWYVGKNKMKDWKACMRTWEQRNKVSNKKGWEDNYWNE